MTDREMLELAAKAAGIKHLSGEYYVSGPELWDIERKRWWRPLTNDGDALRLAVKLGMNIDVGVNPVGFTATAVIADYNSVFVDEYHGENSMKATRRAIVRAAAQIGARM